MPTLKRHDIHPRLGEKSSSACIRWPHPAYSSDRPFRRQLSVGLFCGIKLSNRPAARVRMLDPVLRLFTCSGVSCPTGQPRRRAPLSLPGRNYPSSSGFSSHENSRRKLQHGVAGCRHVVQRGDCGRRYAARASPTTSRSQLADRTTGRVEQAPSPDKRIIYVSDQPQVRVIGAPFVPNTNPRER